MTTEPKLTTTGDEVWVDETWTYAGLRFQRRGVKPLHAWMTPNEEGEQLWSAGADVIGGSYLVETTNGGQRARIKGARYVGTAEVDELTVARWRLEHRTARTVVEAERAEKRQAKENGDVGDLTLRELRAQMHKSLPHQRAGILASVLEYLR